MNIKNIISETIIAFLHENNINNIDTKVVDKTGKPLLMYHGGSYSDGEFIGVGWFTTSKADARHYAKQYDGTITKAYLIIKNPLYSGDIEHLNIPMTKDIIDSVKKRGIEYAVAVKKNNIIKFIEANSAILIAEDLNKDGVIDIHDKEILDAIIFSNNQIILQ